MIFSLLIVGCSAELSHNETLLRAEQFVDEQPDSAITYLAPFDIDSFQAPQDRALYGLVFTEAIHHLGLSIESDSLITVSRRYYEQTDDRERLARALLNHGIILYKQQQTHEAILTMKQAELLAADIDVPVFDFHLFSVLGDVNDNAGNYPLTLKYYRKALHAAERSYNTEWTVRAMNNIAMTFDVLDEPDSLRYYIDMAKPYAPQTQGEVRATYLVNQASYSLHNGKRREALDYLRRAQETFPTDKGYKLLADIYAQKGDTLAACELWYDMLYSFAPDIRIRSFQSLIDYFRHHGNISRVADLSLRLNDVYQELYVQNDAAGIIDMQAHYDDQQRERRQYQKTIGLLAAALLSLVVIGLIIWYNRRRIDQLNAQFIDSQQQYTLTRDELSRLRRQKENEDRLNSRRLKEIVAHLHATANKGKVAADDDWNTLAQLSYALSPTLQRLLSVLSTKEQNVCLLIRQNFLPTEIAVLTASSPQAITNLRVRLMQKLFNTTGGAKDFDQRIRGI